ncbi:SAM-dependent methyltransferase [Streptomyces anthocyanicus]|uniref:SAM-dependent methyltransferase n=1 Tax=Streptomyces anthocyanicus TaxID=68174 RepID=UPI00381FD87B
MSTDVEQHIHDLPPECRGTLPMASATRAMSWLMGEHALTLPPDRALARHLNQAVPGLAEILEINRAFHYHCAEILNQQLGIDQFVSLSPGPHRPWPGRRADLQPPCAAVPGSVFVHVHTLAGAATGSSCRHQHTYEYGGPQEMPRLLGTPAMEALDRRHPIGVLIDAVGPWTASDDSLLGALDTLRAWLPPGSAITFTHATTDLEPASRRRTTGATPWMRSAAHLLSRATGRPYRPRSRAAITNLLAPWPLAGEGVVATGAFFPDHAHARLPEHRSGTYAAVALHPVRPGTGQPQTESIISNSPRELHILLDPTMEQSAADAP